MPRTYFVNVACEDRTGLIAAVTGRLFDLGGNLGDTTFAVLGTGAEFTALVDVPDHLNSDAIRAELADIPEARGATIEVHAYDRSTAHGPLGQATHVVTVDGGDQPGLIARIAEVFGEFGANVLHMEAVREPGRGPEGHYSIRFSVAIPVEAADKCLATIANTAEGMNLRCRAERADAGV